jgi:hypothetical protein
VRNRQGENGVKTRVARLHGPSQLQYCRLLLDQGPPPETLGLSASARSYVKALLIGRRVKSLGNDQKLFLIGKYGTWDAGNRPSAASSQLKRGH